MQEVGKLCKCEHPDSLHQVVTIEHDEDGNGMVWAGFVAKCSQCKCKDFKAQDNLDIIVSAHAKTSKP